MRLLCPHCRKEVQVPDHLAGQIHNCPSCQKPFRVPVPPPIQPGTGVGQAAATPPSVSPAATGVPSPSAGGIAWNSAGTGLGAGVATPTSATAVPGYTPPVGSPATVPPYSTTPPPQSPLSAPAAVTGAPLFQQPAAPAIAPSLALPLPVSSPGYSAAVQILVLTPIKCQLVQFVGVVLLVVLLFCPWLRVPPGIGVLAEQNEFQLAFGRVTGELKANLQPRASPLGIAYFFLSIFAAILCGLLLMAVKTDWPELRTYLRFRHLITGGLIFLLAGLLLLQLLIGFPLTDAWAVNARLSEEDTKKLAPILETLKAPWLDTLVRSITKNPEAHVAWAWGLYASCSVMVLLAVLAMLDFWQQRRSATLPPRLLLEK